MSVGSVNHVSFGQQQVKKTSTARKAAYVGAAIGTAAAITGAVVYRKNISSAFKTIKDILTPLKTKVAEKVNIEGLKNKINNSETAQTIKEGATGLFGKVKNFVTEYAGKAWGYAKQVYNWVTEHAKPMFETVKNFFSEMMQKATNQVK